MTVERILSKTQKQTVLALHICDCVIKVALP